MIVLGIDPGIAIIGIALVEENRGKFFLVHNQAITTPPKTDPSTRLETIYKEINKLLTAFNPDVAALETLIFNTNVTTAFAVGQARGVVLLALAQNKISVSEYTPIQVKMALTGYGRADKNQIQQMVKTIFALSKILSPDDVADAAAIALTHCFSYKMKNSIK